MPGVADSIRRTGLAQEQKSRQRDMEELLGMVRDGRLHEADSRQLETLKLHLQYGRQRNHKTIVRNLP